MDPSSARWAWRGTATWPRGTQSGPRAVARPSWRHPGSFWDLSGGQNVGFSRVFLYFWNNDVFNKICALRPSGCSTWGVLGGQERPKSGQERPKSGPRAAKSGPREAKNTPRRQKSGQEHPKSAPRAAKSGSRAPKSAPRAAKSDPRVAQEQLRVAKLINLLLLVSGLQHINVFHTIKLMNTC